MHRNEVIWAHLVVWCQRSCHLVMNLTRVAKIRLRVQMPCDMRASLEGKEDRDYQ